MIVDPFHNHAVGFLPNGQNFANFSFFIPRLYFDTVPDPYVKFFLGCFHMTSFANEIIFVNSFSRISRAIGPKTRVPRGLFSALIMTAALSSNRTVMPSFRLMGLRVRTMTARTMLDLLMGMFGMDSLTTPMIMSPIPADFIRFPKIRMHMIFLAPVLSAIFK